MTAIWSERCERLFLIVGDKDEGDPDLTLDPPQLDLHPLSQLLVQGRQRLIQKQNLRLQDERPGKGTRCNWPPESVVTFRSPCPAKPMRSSMSAIIAPRADRDTSRRRSP